MGYAKDRRDGEMDADLRFTFVSDRLQAVLGLPVSSLVGKRRTDVPRTDYDNPAWRAHLDDLENRRPFRNFETTVIDASGASRPMMISGTPKFAADGTFEAVSASAQLSPRAQRGAFKAAGKVPRCARDDNGLYDSSGFDSSGFGRSVSRRLTSSAAVSVLHLTGLSRPA
jgi:PAS domain-containing protein